MIPILPPRLARLGMALLLGSAFSWTGHALPPAELQQRLQRRDAVTVIDVRSPQLYAKGHIPGAINIPAAGLALKKLPTLGEVVVCGEGLGRDEQACVQAVEDLNAKPGIRAALLDGGFSAWETAQGLTTAPRGMKRSEVTYITYDQLKQSKGTVQLVDLRGSSVQAQAKKSAGKTQPLTDLSREFPGLSVIKDPFNQASKAAAKTAGPVLVLIDNNDGTSEETARKLQLAGNRRVVVLAGGEEIIAHGGRPGLERQGPGLGPVSPAGGTATTSK